MGTGCRSFRRQGVTFQNTNLTPDTAYQYRVYAINAGGTSPASNTTASLTTNLAPPASFAAAVSNASAGVVLTWNAVTDATSYRIDRSPDNLTWGSSVNVSNQATVTYTDSTALPGTQYYYRIVAIDSVGSSAFSPSAGALTFAITPTGLTETLLTPSTAVLNWNAASGAHTYKVEGYSNSAWSTLATTSTPTYSITGLSAGNTYQYRVSSVDGAGASTPTSAVSVNTPLATPTGFSAAPITATTTSIVWTAVTNATGYKIERSTDGVNWTTTSSSAALVGTDNIAADTVSGGTKYWYRISSNSAGGYSAPSTPVSILTAPIAPTISGSVFSATQININWTPVTGATSYTVSMYNSSNSTYTPISPEPVGAVTSITTTVLPDTEYAFVVQANDATGASAYGTMAGGNVALILTTPLAAPVLSATASTNSSSISLAWSAIADATNYLLQRSTDQATWTTLTQNGGWNSSSASFVDSGLAAGTNFYYRLSAIDAAGNSAYGTANALTVPASPTLSGSAISSTQLNLSSGAVTSATGYSLMVSDGNGGWTNASTQPTGTATSITLTGTADTSYTYELLAHNATGYSTPASITLSTILPAPAAFAVAPTTATSATLSFTAAPHATSYVLQRSPDGNIWSAVTQTLGPTDATFVDTGLSAGTKYYYRMAAVNAAGTSTWSTANVVTLPAAPVLTESGATNTSVTLAWNPVKSATGYTVKVQAQDQTWSAAANQPTGTATTVTISALTADTAYTYEVIANDLVGGTTESSAPSTALPITTALAAPVMSAASATSTAATLNWTAIADATSYVLQRSTDSVVWTSIINSLGASSTTFTDSTVTAGTTYTYRLSAVNANGTSPAATSTVLTAPAAPTLNVDVVSDTSLLLSWNASPGATSYIVEAATVSNGTTTWAAVTPAPSGANTTLTVASLTSDTAYTYHVIAVDGSGNSPTSNPVTATTLISAPTFTAAAASSSSVTLTFTANADATGYLVERSDDAGAIWTTVNQNTLGPTSTTYTDTGLTPGTAYEYRLSAISASGASAPFGPINATTDPDVPVLTGVAASSTEIDLSWTPVLSATGYTLNMNTSGGWVAVNPQPSGAVTSIALTGLSTGTTYTYQLIATNGSLNSAASTTLSVSTLLGPPTTLTYGATTNTSVVLNWTAVNLATSYVVQQSTDQTTWTTLSPGSTITGTTFTDNTVTPGTTYYYRIAANNAQGISDWFNASTPVTTPLNAPTGLVATVNSATQITLDWHADTDFGLTGYRLEISPDGTNGSWTTVATAGPNATEAIDSGLTTGTTYHFRLFALSAGGDSAPSTAILATTN